MTCRWPVRVSLRVGLGQSEGRGLIYHVRCMYKRKASALLALGLPGMISFYARQHSTSCADVASLLFVFFFCSLLLSNLQVGTAGGWSVVGSRVQRGKEGLLTLCRWTGAVVCSAPNGLAGQLSRSLSGRLSWCLGLPRASQGQNQVGVRPEVQVSSGAANRIGSDRGGSDRTEGTLS